LFDIEIPYISLLPTKVINQRKVVLSQQGEKSYKCSSQEIRRLRRITSIAVEWRKPVMVRPNQSMMIKIGFSFQQLTSQECYRMMFKADQRI